MSDIETPTIDQPVMEPALRVKTLIALTQELTAIFVEENNALKARRPGDMALLQADKARLAAAYANTIRQVGEDRGLVESAGDDLLAQLKDITRTFEARAQEQRALLSGAQMAGESVLRAIADEVASQNKPQTYSGNGAAAENGDAAPLHLREQA